MIEEEGELTKIKIRLTPEELLEMKSSYQNEPEQIFEQENQGEPQQPTKIPEEILFQYAQQAALRTNDRMTKVRQDLTVAIKDLEKNRQTTQPYLNNSVHFQADNYPVILIDPSGKVLSNPNNSQAITQSTLQAFIKRNLSQQPNSYLSEVAGYNNFAIQNRRRRKHHFE